MPNTILIIGAASDMAIAIAKKFAAEGCNLQLAARNADRLKPLQSDLNIRHNVNCSLHELDVCEFSTHDSFWQSLQTKPNVTVSVVGFMGDNDEVLKDQSKTIQTINSNYAGPVSILNIVALAYMLQGSGTIVGISSVAGLRGRQSNFIYGSSKAGFTAYLSGLRNKLFHHNVHVATVLPGFVYTKMTEHLNLPKLLTAQPEDVGTAVFNAVKKKKNVVYIKWFWRWIMLIITSIPEFIFKKKKL